MRTYRPPRKSARLGPRGSVSPGPPRAFAEWRALRRWSRLPPAERDVAGYLLRVLREEAGFSQAALAARLGTTQQAVSQAERWTSNPTVDFVRQWASACGKDLSLDRGLQFAR